MKKIFLVFLIFGVFALSGCSKEVQQISDITKKASQDLDVAKIKNRDAKRINDAKMLNTIIQLYALDAEKLPTIKDDKGNFRAFKLIKNSSDFVQLETEIKSKDSSQSLLVDPTNPERFYEFYSDGKIYTIKASLEQNNVENCKEVKPGYCEYVINGDLKSVLE